MRLANKRVWVTAAANGIGRATASLCAKEGAKVFATDIDAAGLATLGAAITTSLLDATDGAATAAYAASLGDIDAAIHCVGWVHQGAVLDCSPEDWRRSFQLNVDTFYNLLRAVLPGFLARRSGSVLCIASVASSIKGLPARAAYGASKAAMLGLVKATAADTVGAGVRVNAVCPGTVLSPSLLDRVDALDAELGGNGEAMDRFVARQPMGRLGNSEEIAEMCLYLASDASRFVTGQFLTIDGGISI